MGRPGPPVHPTLDLPMQRVTVTAGKVILMTVSKLKVCPHYPDNGQQLPISFRDKCLKGEWRAHVYDDTITGATTSKSLKYPRLPVCWWENRVYTDRLLKWSRDTDRLLKWSRDQPY